MCHWLRIIRLHTLQGHRYRESGRCIEGVTEGKKSACESSGMTMPLGQSISTGLPQAERYSKMFNTDKTSEKVEPRWPYGNTVVKRERGGERERERNVSVLGGKTKRQDPAERATHPCARLQSATTHSQHKTDCAISRLRHRSHLRASFLSKTRDIISYQTLELREFLYEIEK